MKEKFTKDVGISRAEKAFFYASFALVWIEFAFQAIK